MQRPPQWSRFKMASGSNCLSAGFQVLVCKCCVCVSSHGPASMAKCQGQEEILTPGQDLFMGMYKRLSWG